MNNRNCSLFGNFDINILALYYTPYINYSYYKSILSYLLFYVPVLPREAFDIHMVYSTTAKSRPACRRPYGVIIYTDVRKQFQQSQTVR